MKLPYIRHTILLGLLALTTGCIDLVPILPI